jgi:hypothetical protein
MPAFLEPNQAFSVVLDIDKDKPKDVQPTFMAKALSMREQRKLLSMLDRLNEDYYKSHDEAFKDAVDALSKVVTGWKNMGSLVFSPEAFEDVLSYTESRELLRKIANNQHVQLEEKKS